MFSLWVDKAWTERPVICFPTFGNTRMGLTKSRYFLSRVNVSFVIDTDVVKGINVPAQATFTWPSLSPDKPVKFPLTQIGNYSIKTFLLENPSDTDVVAQVVPLFNYQQLQGVLDFMTDPLYADSYGSDQGEHSCFSLPKAEAPKVKPVTPFPFINQKEQLGYFAVH